MAKNPSVSAKSARPPTTKLVASCSMKFVINPPRRRGGASPAVHQGRATGRVAGRYLAGSEPLLAGAGRFPAATCEVAGRISLASGLERQVHLPADRAAVGQPLTLADGRGQVLGEGGQSSVRRDAGDRFGDGLGDRLPGTF